jgi:hypothetical protein
MEVKAPTIFSNSGAQQIKKHEWIHFLYIYIYVQWNPYLLSSEVLTVVNNVTVMYSLQTPASCLWSAGTCPQVCNADIHNSQRRPKYFRHLEQINVLIWTGFVRTLLYCCNYSARNSEATLTSGHWQSENVYHDARKYLQLAALGAGPRHYWCLDSLIWTAPQRACLLH